MIKTIMKEELPKKEGIWEIWERGLKRELPVDKDMFLWTGFKITIKKGERWEDVFSSFVNGEITKDAEMFLMTDLDCNPLIYKYKQI